MQSFHPLVKCTITQNIYIKKEVGGGKKVQQMFGAFSDAFVEGVGKLSFSRAGQDCLFLYNNL